MTQDQINQLAHKCAEYFCPKSIYEGTDAKKRDEDMQCCINEATTVISWLLRDHLIVEKEKADNLWEASQLGGLQPHEDVVQADAVAYALKYLFPETFNQDEQ